MAHCDLCYGFQIQAGYDKLIIEREVYKFSDWANDLGGLHGFVTIFLSGLIPLVSGLSLENHLVESLFRQSTQT